jgi:error-prone DNA polymerase
MICRADTVGVFQIESRAQMSMLPRLKPRCFYDLVIEVAIVRPGPIQGGMVHPYLRRRNGEEPVTYPNEAIKEALKRTLGVPLFQEQAMRLAVVAAGFTPGEADQLRRAMGAWRRNGDITRFRTKLIEGMKANGLSEEYAQRCFEQICGFGEYGFPESHAASFALLVYVSAWLKRYHPAAFCAAIINSQPMGFYQPAQLVRDAREHGVSVLPIDVNHSGYDCRLETPGVNDTKSHPETSRGRNLSRHRREPARCSNDLETLTGERESARAEARGSLRTTIDNRQSAIRNRQSAIANPSVRLGMRLINGISQAKVEGIERAQSEQPFRSVADLARRSDASRATLARLAAADAMRSMGLNRRQAVWNVLALSDEPPMFEGFELEEPAPALPEASLDDEVFADYATIGLSLNAHPISLVRPELRRMGVQQNRVLKHTRQGQWISVSGLVLVRQRPGTAAGIVFCTLEDETGTANLIIRPNIYEKYRRTAHGSAALVAEGRVERQGEVVHLQVTRLKDMSKSLTQLRSVSRDFH